MMRLRGLAMIVVLIHELYSSAEMALAQLPANPPASAPKRAP